MTPKINKLIDDAGFVRFLPDEDRATPIDWSCDYTNELNALVKLLVSEFDEASKRLEQEYNEYRLRTDDFVEKDKYAEAAAALRVLRSSINKSLLG